MHVGKMKEMPKFVYKDNGNLYYMLVPRDITEAMESCLVYLEKGDQVEEHSHAAEEQMYVVLKGKGRLKLGGKETTIGPGMVVYIPRKTKHQVSAITSTLVYVYVAVWPKGIPADNKDWKKAMKVV